MKKFYYIPFILLLVIISSCEGNDNSTEKLLHGIWNADKVFYNLVDSLHEQNTTYTQEFKKEENVWVFNTQEERIYSYKNGKVGSEYTEYFTNYSDEYPKIIIDYGKDSAMWYVEEVNEQQLVLFSYIAIQDSTRKQCNSTLRCHLFFTKLNNQ